jgi:hypothetical protein
MDVDTKSEHTDDAALLSLKEYEERMRLTVARLVTFEQGRGGSTKSECARGSPGSLDLNREAVGALRANALDSPQVR